MYRDPAVVKDHYDALLIRIGKEFEASLGPWMLQDLVQTADIPYARALVFHPRQHYALRSVKTISDT